MSSQNSSLIDQLGSLQEKHEKELQRFLVEHEGEKKALIMRREDVADEQRSISSLGTCLEVLELPLSGSMCDLPDNSSRYNNSDLLYYDVLF